MSPQAQKEYTEIMHLRYKNATRKEKSNILDEYCATCQCHRKHGIRKLRGFKRFTKPKPRETRQACHLSQAGTSPRL